MNIKDVVAGISPTLIAKLAETVAGKRVYVGVSGGVDSAVSLALLQAAGADLLAVFMKNWAGEQGLQLDCPWEEDQKSAAEVAEQLGVEFVSFNFEQEYKEHVLDYFFSEYKAGRTPNPDILCNSEIKFKAFLQRARAEGAQYIATGHYAGKATVDYFGKKIELITKGVDANKDQSYFLSGLNSVQIAAAVFPLAELTKTQVRQIAKELGLANADRKDSQGICFIGDLDVQTFLRKYISRKSGPIFDIDTNRVVGEHDGISFLTIGQREGIGVGGVEKPYYVVSKDMKSNTVFVAQGRDNPHLYSTQLKIAELFLFAGSDYSLAEIGNNLHNSLTATIRYRGKADLGEFIDEATFEFNQPQWAASPGQSIVFYDGEICLGRAVIADSAN